MSQKDNSLKKDFKLTKVLTGIPGFDQITKSCLPGQRQDGHPYLPPHGAGIGGAPDCF